VTDAANCFEGSTEPPCAVHVRLTYEFRLFISIPPFPATIQLNRDSTFKISNLEPPPP
jgi:hypothetical protein